MSVDALPRPELGREIATTADGIDITRGYVGPLLTPYDSVLRSRGGGDLVIYEQVFSDEEVKSTFSQRQLAVTQREWQVDAGGDRAIDIAAADYLREQLYEAKFDNVTSKMHYGVYYGYAVAEMIYKPDSSRIGIQDIRVRNRRRFRYSKEGELRLLTMHNMFEGIPCPAPYFWDFQTGADNDDEPYGLGLAHWLYWPTLFKRNGMKFWLIFLEKFGMPTGIGRYDQTANAEERAKLLQSLRAIQTDSGVIIPMGMEVELLEAARSGTGDYKTLHDTMNAAIQKVVVGQTASTQGTAGRLGNDQLQADVRADIIKADADLLCESFNRGPARWLTQWNFPNAAIPRVYRVTDEPEDLESRAKRDKLIYDIGFRPTLAYVTDTYGGEWVERATVSPVVPEDTESAISSAQFSGTDDTVMQLLRRHYPAAFASATPRTPDVTQQMATQLDRLLQPVGEQWIAKIRAAIDSAQSLEQLRDSIFELQPDMDLDEYANLMRAALTAAELAGRADILRGV